MPKVQGESELWSAIAAFEHILEVMPTDRLALETLADAYQKLGDLTQASQHLLKLVDIVVSSADVQAVPGLVDKLKQMGADDVFIQARQRLESLLNTAGEKPAKDARTPTAARKTVDISREIALAWELLQAGKLAQDDYSHVVQDLSENSTKPIEVPVTVLHALHDRQFKHIDKIVAHLSRTSGRPMIPLANFEITKDACSILPLEFMTRRGAIVFELMGKNDALVAVLNPFDVDLLDDVQRVSKRACHFFVVGAAEYDAALLGIRKSLSKG